MPGGVNSSVRAFNTVGGIPPFIAHAEVVSTAQDQAALGLGYGAPMRLENEMAELVVSLSLQGLVPVGGPLAGVFSAS